MRAYKSELKKYRITYFYKPDYDNVVINILVKSEEEAIAFAKDYRSGAFNVEKVEEAE